MAVATGRPPLPVPPGAQQVCSDSMSFDLPAAALAAAIEELGTAAELAASAQGSVAINVVNELGGQGEAGRRTTTPAWYVAGRPDHHPSDRFQDPDQVLCAVCHASREVACHARAPIATSLSARLPAYMAHLARPCDTAPRPPRCCLQTGRPAWRRSPPSCSVPEPCCAGWNKRSPSCSCTQARSRPSAAICGLPFSADWPYGPGWRGTRDCLLYCTHALAVWHLSSKANVQEPRARRSQTACVARCFRTGPPEWSPALGPAFKRADNGLTRPGAFLFELLGMCGINVDTWQVHCAVLCCAAPRSAWVTAPTRFAPPPGLPVLALRAAGAHPA